MHSSTYYSTRECSLFLKCYHFRSRLANQHQFYWINTHVYTYRYVYISVCLYYFVHISVYIRMLFRQCRSSLQLHRTDNAVNEIETVPLSFAMCIFYTLSNWVYFLSFISQKKIKSHRTFCDVTQIVF